MKKAAILLCVVMLGAGFAFSQDTLSFEETKAAFENKPTPECVALTVTHWSPPGLLRDVTYPEDPLFCLHSGWQSEPDSESVVRTRLEYEALLSIRNQIPRCRDFKLPDIDFKKYTLLGKHVRGTGCETRWDREVCLDQKRNAATYSIHMAQIGGCEPIRSSMNWILIPKLPEGCEVIFSVTKTWENYDGTPI